MQLRQFLRYFEEETIIRVETTIGEGNDKQDVLLFSGSIYNLMSTSQFFNSILDSNIKEESVAILTKGLKVNV